MFPQEVYEQVNSDGQLRQAWGTSLTLPDDPYFDVFLTIACFYAPTAVLEEALRHPEDGRGFAEAFATARICEIGKGAYSRAFRAFGSRYLAVSDGPWNPSYPDQVSREDYTGTVRKELIDLRSFPGSSLSGQEFDITLSNSLLGDPYATHLLAGSPPDLRASGVDRCLPPVRNLLAVFSNITRPDSISVHRCDRPLMERLHGEGYLDTLGFSTDALLDPEVDGGFIPAETIAVLRKTHPPRDGTYATGIDGPYALEIRDGVCKVALPRQEK